MAIQLRRGHQGDLDITKLLPGEAAVCLDTGKVIVKLAGGNYLTLTDTPELRAIVDGKAPASHSHAPTDVTGLAEILAGKQNTLVAGTNITLTPNTGEGTVTIAAAGGSSGIQGDVLFDSPSGAIVTNASPSITFDTGKSVSGITDGYLEVLFKQNSGTNGGVNSARALIHTVSGSVVVEPVQLLGWEYDSANSALALTGCAGTVSNGNTLTFANAESAAFSFTVYRIVSYKAVRT